MAGQCKGEHQSSVVLQVLAREWICCRAILYECKFCWNPEANKTCSKFCGNQGSNPVPQNLQQVLRTKFSTYVLVNAKVAVSFVFGCKFCFSKDRPKQIIEMGVVLYCFIPWCIKQHCSTVFRVDYYCATTYMAVKNHLAVRRALAVLQVCVVWSNVPRNLCRNRKSLQEFVQLIKIKVMFCRLQLSSKHHKIAKL